jgi:hypothetical protein
MIYARFAWAIFCFIESFLLLGKQRRLMLRVSGQGGSDLFNAEECEKHTTTATKKRKRTGDGTTDDDETDDEMVYDKMY